MNNLPTFNLAGHQCSGVPAWNFRLRSELLLRFLTLLNSAQTSGAE